MSKVMICFLSILMTIVYVNSITVFANRDMLTHMKILDEKGFSNTDIVTRGECLITIMRAIGISDEDVKLLNGADFVAFEDTSPYSYFGCAYRAKIAYGEECTVDYPTYRTSHTGKNTDFFFFPERAVTLKETMAFMVRCLEEVGNTNIDSTFEKAIEYGLIQTQDNFVQNSGNTISQDDFIVLLQRFLNQKRYKYYDSNSGGFTMECNLDQEHSISYLDMHSRNTN